jgi:uncharacterized protein YgbK (DUF1537 family)
MDQSSDHAPLAWTQLQALADDLTGACDVGAELLGYGVPVRVTVDGADGPAGDGIDVLNTQSRLLDTAAARARVVAVAGLLPAVPGRVVLKKIDTALRGPVGAELDGALEALGLGEAFVLPAIPEVGRATVGGVQHLDGQPMHETAFSTDPHHPLADASVPRALEAGSRRRVARIGLGEVRRPDLDRFVAAQRAAGYQVAVFDASTDDDIDRAVRILLPRRPVLLVGSTGLAGALRRAGGGAWPVPAAVPTRPGGVLVVAGSPHPATRAAVRHAVACGAGVLAQPTDAPAAGERLARGEAVILAAREEAPNGTDVARLLGEAGGTLVRRLAGDLGALVLIGGETAYQVLRAAGIARLVLRGRYRPLVATSMPPAGPARDLTIVTKGGSSGGAGGLTDLLRWLQGTVDAAPATGRGEAWRDAR